MNAPHSAPQPTRAPRRPTVTTLWAHLGSRAIAQSPSSSAQEHPSLATNPIDKLGTSARVLLLDTQQNMEKLSKQVEKLSTNVEERGRDIPTLERIFDERLTTLTDVIQKSISDAARIQHDEIRDLIKRFDGLDSKMDTMSMGQQTQARASQSLGEQLAQALPIFGELTVLVRNLPIHTENLKLELKADFHSGCIDTARSMEKVCGEIASVIGIMRSTAQETLNSIIFEIKNVAQTKVALDQECDGSPSLVGRPKDSVIQEFQPLPSKKRSQAEYTSKHAGTSSSVGGQIEKHPAHTSSVRQTEPTLPSSPPALASLPTGHVDPPTSPIPCHSNQYISIPPAFSNEGVPQTPSISPSFPVEHTSKTTPSPLPHITQNDHASLPQLTVPNVVFHESGSKKNTSTLETNGLKTPSRQLRNSLRSPPLLSPDSQSLLESTSNTTAQSGLDIASVRRSKKRRGSSIKFTTPATADTVLLLSSPRPSKRMVLGASRHHETLANCIDAPASGSSPAWPNIALRPTARAIAGKSSSMMPPDTSVVGPPVPQNTLSSRRTTRAASQNASGMMSPPPRPSTSLLNYPAFDAAQLYRQPTIAERLEEDKRTSARFRQKRPRIEVDVFDEDVDEGEN